MDSSYDMVVVGGGLSEAAFRVETSDGGGWDARRVLVTTGLVDELPDIPGLRERWDRDVVHCPYCFGWEIRDAPLGVVATGPQAAAQALLWRQWNPDVILFLHTAPDPTDEQMEQLAARGISVVEGEIATVVVEDDRLSGVRLQVRTRRRPQWPGGWAEVRSPAAARGMGWRATSPM